MGRPVPHIPPRPLRPGSEEVLPRLEAPTQHPGGWVGVLGAWKKTPRAVSMVETSYGARCALLARASRKRPPYSQSQTEGIPSAATLLSCVGLSVFCTRKCNSQGPLLDLALTQSLTWPPSALIDHFTRARGPAVLREEMYGTFGAHAFLSPVVCIRDPPLALAGLPA